jgi:hypothetical protein
LAVDMICGIQCHRLDSNEKLSTTWFRGGTGLNLKWLGFCHGCGCQMGAHL